MYSNYSLGEKLKTLEKRCRKAQRNEAKECAVTALSTTNAQTVEAAGHVAVNHSVITPSFTINVTKMDVSGPTEITPRLSGPPAPSKPLRSSKLNVSSATSSVVQSTLHQNPRMLTSNVRAAPPTSSTESTTATDALQRLYNNILHIINYTFRSSASTH